MAATEPKQREQLLTPADKLEHANFWIRWASTAMDASLVLSVVALVNFVMLTLMRPFLATGNYLALFFFFLLPLYLIGIVYYYIYLNADGRQTVGKRVFGLVVINSQIKPIRISESALRAIGFVLDTIPLGLGHVICAFTQNKQTVHDMLAGSYVIRIRPQRKGEQITTFSTLLISVCLVPLLLFSFSFFVNVHRITSPAMKPTILDGEFILVDQFGIYDYEPQRGDMVVLKFLPATRGDNIRRCIATAGQSVEITQGQVFVDGEPEGKQQIIAKFFDKAEMRNIERSEVLLGDSITYIIQHTVRETEWRENYRKVTVPEGSIFVIGDNRDNSSDSRHSGFVPVSHVSAKAGLIGFSRSMTGPVRSTRWSRIGRALDAELPMSGPRRGEQK